MEFLISLICGNAQRLYGRGQVMLAAFHNLPDTHPTQSFVVLPSVHADKKGMRRDMQCGQDKDGLAEGWTCSSWQEKQIRLLETGALGKQVRSANAAYGFGKGAEEALSREAFITLKAFSSQVLAEYFK